MQEKLHRKGGKVSGGVLLQSLASHGPYLWGNTPTQSGTGESPKAFSIDSLASQAVLLSVAFFQSRLINGPVLLV